MSWNDTDWAKGELKSESNCALGPPMEITELRNLKGAKIVGIGFHPAADEGGLAIDYEKNGRTRRIVFGYTELGLWVYWDGEIK